MRERTSLAGARLLVLGAGPYQVPVIQRAIDLGCYVICIDNAPHNPGHRLAAASEIVSTVNETAVVDVAVRYGIDGVLTYGSDVSVPAVAAVAEHLGLPGNSRATAARLTRKDHFRTLQRDIGLPHPVFASGRTPEELIANAARAALRYPVLLKPVDASGSKGQVVARSPADLDAHFGIPRAFSRCGAVLAEEILPDDTMELVCEAAVEDGRLVFAHYGHNWFCDARHPRVPAGEIVPGRFAPAVVHELDRQLQAVISASGIRSGCMNADALLSNGQVVILDIGLRNGGYFLPEVVRLSTGVNLTTAAIQSALGVPLQMPFMHAPTSRCIMSQVLHAHIAGRFERLAVDPSIEPLVISITSFVAPGDSVKPFLRGDAGAGLILFAPSSVDAAFDLVTRLPHPCGVHVNQD